MVVTLGPFTLLTDMAFVITTLFERLPPGVGVAATAHGKPVLARCSGVPLIGTREDAEPVRVGSVGYLRLQRVVELQVFPYRQVGPGRVEYLPSMDVRVAFRGTPGASRHIQDDLAWEGLYERVLVNYQQARGWRLRPEGSVGPWLPPPDGVRLSLERPGIYGVTRGDLQQAGVDVALHDF